MAFRPGNSEITVDIGGHHGFAALDLDGNAWQWLVVFIDNDTAVDIRLCVFSLYN